MMGFSADNFFQAYIKNVKGKDKIEDNFQTGKQKLFPFTTNPTTGSTYDGSCGLNGVAGEFYRIITQSSVEPILTPSDTEIVLRNELHGKFKMPADDIERFIKVFNDVMFENGTLSVFDLSFFSFVPIKYYDSKDPNAKKYRAGQLKMADYYVSIAANVGNIFEHQERDLFCHVVSTCLQKDSFVAHTNRDGYYILPFVKKQFADDLQWLMQQNNQVMVRYFPLLLYFYASYSLVQTLMFMNKDNWKCSTDRPIPVYFMLASERASAGIAAVKKGWSAPNHLPDSFLSRLFPFAQALDILNSMFEDVDEIMTYQEIMARFDEMDFDDEAKAICEHVLTTYQEFKYDLLSHRKDESGIKFEKQDINLHSFREFVDLLLDRCIAYQPNRFKAMKKAVYSLLNIRLFQKRREHSVLVLDDDMLLFLVAMMVKKDRVKLDELFRRFQDYGIEFSFQTKNAISDYLLKLNLLERKSDSGDAQYVRVVL